MRDLTDRRRWEVAGGEVARFRSMVHHATALTMLLDADGVVTSVSGAITRQLGHDPELVCDHPLVRIVHPDDRILVRGAIVAAAAAAPGDAPTPVEARLAGPRSSFVPFELSIVSLLDDPTVAGMVVSGHDISRLRAAQEALAELAHFDALTGLPNRRAFDAALEDQWTLTARDGIDSFVVVADLDRFKELNDRHGHATGDEALRQVGGALRRTVRATDFVARLGGDEFGIILIRCGGEAAARGFAAELCERIEQACRPLPSVVAVSLGHASLARCGVSRSRAARGRPLHVRQQAAALTARSFPVSETPAVRPSSWSRPSAWSPSSSWSQPSSSSQPSSWSQPSS